MSEKILDRSLDSFQDKLAAEVAFFFTGLPRTTTRNLHQDEKNDDLA
jgi:hypothetical protein